MYSDSVDKIMMYVTSITKQELVYKNKLYQPKRIRVSLQIFRGYTCPAFCGGCCPRFSLDYLPEEAKLVNHPLTARSVMVNGKNFTIHSDVQADGDHHCNYLNREDARCGIHKQRPFTCDMELIRFKNGITDCNINVQKFGRAWQLLRVDGKRGALCEITPPDPESIADTIRKLTRLRDWCIYFEVDTYIDEIIAWCKSSPTQPLIFEKIEAEPTKVNVGGFL